MTTHNAADPPAGRPSAAGDDLRPQVLVVEENVAAIGAASDIARRLGYRVTVASGMLAGLEAMRGTQFKLLLLELQMAGMGGAEGLQRLRRQKMEGPGFATPFDTVAIALTRLEQVTDGERLREAGFDDHLARPFRASEMRVMLNKHLAAAISAAVLPASPVARADPRGTGRLPGSAEAHDAGDMLDPQALARLAELDPKGEGRLIERVLQAFQSAAARLGPQAEAARRSGDRKTLRLVAHTLKSSSASIGAMRLAQICAAVETSIRLDSTPGPTITSSAPQGGVSKVAEPHVLTSVGDLDPQLDAMEQALAAALQAISRRLGGAA